MSLEYIASSYAQLGDLWKDGGDCLCAKREIVEC